MTFDDVVVSDANRLGAEGAGFILAMKVSRGLSLTNYFPWMLIY